MTSAVLLPYHQDEHLDSITLPGEVAGTVINPSLPAGDQWQRLAVLYDALATAVSAAAGPGKTVVAVTGDCLATLGTLAGLQRAGADPSVIWFDAHGDVHTLASSTSGYLGGMALRMALGGDAEKLSGPLGLHLLAEDRAVLVDARDLDPAEVAYLAESAVRRVQVGQVKPEDVPQGPILLHVDVDVIDAAELPGLRFPVSGGPAAGEVLAAVGRLLATGRVAALDIACPWFAPAGVAQANARTALLAEFLTRVSDT